MFKRMFSPAWRKADLLWTVRVAICRRGTGNTKRGEGKRGRKCLWWKGSEWRKAGRLGRSVSVVGVWGVEGELAMNTKKAQSVWWKEIGEHLVLGGHISLKTTTESEPARLAFQKLRSRRTERKKALCRLSPTRTQGPWRLCSNDHEHFGCPGVSSLSTHTGERDEEQPPGAFANISLPTLHSLALSLSESLETRCPFQLWEKKNPRVPVEEPATQMEWVLMPQAENHHEDL